MIIYNLEKNNLTSSLALRTEPVDHDLRPDDLVAAVLFQTIDRDRIEFDITINDLMAARTDQMGMWVWAIAIIMAVIVQVDFGDLVHFFQ